ncbi:hypothetical protein Pmani_006812 [Petrolisthes manimaculis]|uniref:Peptidase aspartic putative domain-containing protein n=1 Tax=Petrolisthes manimaculis TaxID=1843537 RepID=A0AAE1UG61_9EUCA|nr:hypothetical protein Pmani_006812 [Petrolisthes manimaculis]
MSKEMQEAKKRRAAAKGWVTRSVKELQDLFDDDTTSFELLDAAVSVFDHRLTAFDEQQTAVELLLEDDYDLEADIDETDKFHKYARKIRAEAAKHLKGARDGSDKGKVRAFANKKSQGSQDRNVYDVKLIDSEGNNHSVFAVEVTTICPPLSRQRVPYDVLRSLSHLQLNDDYGHDRDLTLDILVGVDNYWRFVSADNVVRFDDLVAHESKCGWILSGSCLKTHEESVSHQLLCISTTSHVTESELHNFWNLESIGIYAQKDPVLDTFEETVKYVDGRFEVALPWKSNDARNGIVRSVNVKNAKGMLCRPVQKIHDLEICYDVNSAEENSEVPVECPDEEVDKVDTDENDETENPEQVKVSRSGRVVKPRTVLDL